MTILTQTHLISAKLSVTIRHANKANH